MKKSILALAITASLVAPVAPVQAGDGGAIAAGVIGGLAAGAIIGSAVSQPRPYYGPPPAVVEQRVYVEPEPEMCVTHREVWSERYRAYVVRKVHVPC
jgi:hypothetical protein